MDLITTGAGLALAHKLLGKTGDEISEDIAHLYKVGRDKVVQVAIRKTKNIEDGATANLRVARDVFWNGSFTDEAICAEYFGGILASSRSANGKDDTGVFYVDIIKSLSACQLKLHYLIYRSLNKELLDNKEKAKLNPGLEQELQNENIFLLTKNLIDDKSDFGADIHALASKGLIGQFQTHNEEVEGGVLPYIKITPKSLGVQLFAIANNAFGEWRNFASYDFGDFGEVSLPAVYAQSVDELLLKLNLKKRATT